MTRRPRLFFWTYPPYLITALVSVIAFTAFTARSASDYYLELSSLQLRETTAVTANAVRPLVARGAGRDEIQALCSALAAGSRIRLTVIDPDGRVVADTDATSERMDFHLDREEVREAWETGSGSAVRRSVSTGITTTYEAIRLRDSDGRDLALLRAAMPFDIVGSRSDGLLRGLLAFGVCLSAAVSLLALFVSRRIARPILRIHAGALLFAEGRLDERIPEDGPLEVAELAAVMNRMARDLDDRIRTVALQKSEVDSILNGMSEAVAVVDARMTVLTGNPAFRRMFPGEALAGVDESPADDASPAPGTGEVRPGRDGLLSLTRNTDICDFMELALRANGPLETAVSTYGDNPRQLRLTSASLGDGKAVLVINDLTHMNRLETVRRDFTTNVSHELKTPITSIKAALETLQDAGFSDRERAESFLEIAVRGTERLEAILSDLFDLARVEEDEKRGIDKERVEIDSIINSVLGDVAGRLRDGSIRIQREGESGLAVLGNAGLLRQALHNLVDNAIKYAPNGGAIEILTAEEAGCARLSVRDHGPGIPARDRDRVFERFYRVDRARSRDSGGTGLGLAIVKHIAQIHSGSVRLESSEGTGSTFSILVPLAPGDDVA